MAPSRSPRKLTIGYALRQGLMLSKKLNPFEIK
jgi:hypothetical protein